MTKIIALLLLLSFLLLPFQPALAGEELNDHLSSASLITNETGAVAQKLDYFPFGSERLNEKFASFETRFTYTDQESDTETGLLYYGARYYHPAIGRFTQPDPVVLNSSRKEFQLALQNPQLLNGYSYVGNNPLRYLDSTGELGEEYNYFWRSVSEGTKTVKHFFSNIAEDWRAGVDHLSTDTSDQVWGSMSYTIAEGFDSIASVFDCAEKVTNPERALTEKAVPVVLLSLDLSSGVSQNVAPLHFG